MVHKIRHGTLRKSPELVSSKLSHGIVIVKPKPEIAAGETINGVHLEIRVQELTSFLFLRRLSEAFTQA